MEVFKKILIKNLKGWFVIFNLKRKSIIFLIIVIILLFIKKCYFMDVN